MQGQCRWLKKNRDRNQTRVAPYSVRFITKEIKEGMHNRYRQAKAITSGKRAAKCLRPTHSKLSNQCFIFLKTYRFRFQSHFWPVSDKFRGLVGLCSLDESQ